MNSLFILTFLLMYKNLFLHFIFLNVDDLSNYIGLGE